MRLSTSNSEWVKIWLLAVVVAIGLLATWECILRSVGHKPTVVDSPCLWSYWREQAKGDRCIVVLGDSRPLTGFDAEACRAILPAYSVVNLSICGLYSPVAVLRDLAGDEQFCGTVLVCTTEYGLQRAHWEVQAGYVSYYHRNYRANTRANMLVSRYLRQRLAMLHPNYKLDLSLLSLAKTGSLPVLADVETRPDRTTVIRRPVEIARQGRSHLVNELRRMWSRNQAVSPCQWLDDALELDRYVRMIQARGGRVVYVKYPVVDESWDEDEKVYPKAQCWDVFAARTAATCVHFRDYPELACYDCPDSSHLDRHDVPSFTATLIRVLKDRAVLASQERG